MKSVLVIAPYENIYPPMSGGMQRCFHILHQLSRHFLVTAIFFQDKNSFKEATKHFPDLESCEIINANEIIREKDLFDLLPRGIAQALRYRFWKRSWAGPADGNFMSVYPALQMVLAKKKFDVAILDNLSSLKLSDVIRRADSSCRLVYNSYNVDTRLAETEFKEGLISESDFNGIRKAESEMHHEVNAIITCSQSDLDEMKRMNHQHITGEVIPNGIFIPRKELSEPLTDRKDTLLFCGSLDYFPNREGLLWFCQEIFPLILKDRPYCRLAVVGKGDAGKELMEVLMHPSIDNYGRVEEVSSYYEMSRVAIVPLLSGSGTRLKILEAMGLGTPVVSTSKGAEGIDYVSGENILIADDEARFSKEVVNLLQNKQLAESITRNAFQLVIKQYDWNIIGDKLKNFLENDNRSLQKIYAQLD